MNNAVAQLSPASVWENFERLNAVPRPSKQEERVIAFMQDFGRSLGLETITDAIGNVIIRKPATAGMQNRKTIILQAHLDMVHQKNASTQFDFQTEGIRSFIDGGWVKAEGTTLGADNGMGVAMIMAVLQATDLVHGPIEALFTIDEETGMTGAKNLDGSLLHGSILLNLDTEDEGELCIGCAGGLDTNVVLTYEQEATPAGKALHISLKGLRGGHSGGEIHLGRGNANKLMNRMLWPAFQRFGLRVSSIDGGSLRNAIPRESFAVVVVPAEQEAAFLAYLSEQEAIFRAELQAIEPNLSLTATPAEQPAKVMSVQAQLALLAGIYSSPCGVIRMSDSLPGLVETSTSLARVLAKDGNAKVQFLSRSSVETAKTDVAQQIEAAFALSGAEVSHSGDYPGWTPNPQSEILSLMRQTYKTLFGKEAVVNAVHAGLECGIIGERKPGMDMISFGPTIKNPHSPDEMCEIASVELSWQYMLEVLRNAPLA